MDIPIRVLSIGEIVLFKRDLCSMGLYAKKKKCSDQTAAKNVNMNIY